MGYHRKGNSTGNRVQGHLLPLDFSTTECFLCNKPINVAEAWAYWHGAGACGAVGSVLRADNTNIILHPACAKDLAMHLAKDAFLAEGGTERMGNVGASA